MGAGTDTDAEALVHSARALALAPTFAHAFNNRAQSLLALHRFDEGMAALETAIDLDPEFGHAHWNVALTRLLLGDFETCWSLRERGRTLRGFFVDRKFNQPQWHGAASNPACRPGASEPKAANDTEHSGVVGKAPCCFVAGSGSLSS